MPVVTSQLQLGNNANFSGGSSGYLADAPKESAWSIIPLLTTVRVSKPLCGCRGNPGIFSPWYMLQPSLFEKSFPIFLPDNEEFGDKSILASG